MIVRKLIVSACAGCNRITGDVCSAYLDPSVRHRTCVCPLKYTGRVEYVATKKGRKVNPLKASKRARRGR